VSAEPIVAVEEVPSDGTFCFRVESSETGEEREAILVRGDEGVFGWFNACQHLTHVALDKGDGAPLRDGEIVCTNHGAMFEVGTGRCTYGPCEGAYLNDVGVCVDDGEVYLEDPALDYVGPGPVESAAWDLGSTSNVEF